jgi:RNA polymerase sigma factor (sigma-70 family)
MNDFQGTKDAWGPPTRWTLVRRAASSTLDEEAQQAWRALIERYRTPVRACLRRALCGHVDAEIAADDFFAYLFEQRILPRVSADEVRFRCYMQYVARLFAKSWSRGQRSRTVSNDEALEVLLPPDQERIDDQEEAEWASDVLSHALDRLRARYATGTELLIRFYGLGSEPSATCEELARETGKTANAIHQAVHRAREHLKELVLAEIRDLSATNAGFEQERELIMNRMVGIAPGLLAEPGKAVGM